MITNEWKAFKPKSHGLWLLMLACTLMTHPSWITRGQPIVTITEFDAPDAASFDDLMEEILYDNRLGGVIIHLDGSHFYTSEGIRIPTQNYPLLKIQGNGKDQTTLHSVNPPTDPSGIFTIIPRESRWIVDFQLENLTIDCHGEAHPKYADGPGPYKVAAVSVHCTYGRVENVKVAHFAARGTGIPQCGQAGTEVFPLILRTIYKPSPSAPRLLIKNCEVSDFLSKENGYCTAIMANTVYFEDPEETIRHPNNDDAGTVSDVIARVESNHVHDVEEGIAFGTARSENVVFAGNLAERVRAGFNCDTAVTGGLNHDIRIENNQFLECNEGISIGAPGTQVGSFQFFTITGNYISLIGPYPASPPYYPECYALRLHGGTSYFTVSGNTASKAQYFPEKYYLVRNLDHTSNLTCFQDCYYSAISIQSNWLPINEDY